MRDRILVGLLFIAVVDYVCGFNPLPAVPVHRGPRVQPQTAPNGVSPPPTMPGRRPSFLPPTASGFSASSFLPPTPRTELAFSATQQGQEREPTSAQEMEAAAWGEPAMTGPVEGENSHLENQERVVAMQADGDSWYGGFAAGVFAGFSALLLALRSRIWRQSSAASQLETVELRQNQFSAASSDPLLVLPGLGGAEPMYTASAELRGVLQGSLVAHMSPPATADAPPSVTGAGDELQAFIDETNVAYERVHKSFEEQFWGNKMKLTGDYSIEKLSSTKDAMEAFLRDEERYSKVQGLLSSGAGTEEQVKVLQTFDRTFSCYLMKSKEATDLRTKITQMESKLESARDTMSLGYTEPDGTARFVELSSVGLRNKMTTADDEAVRKACFEGVRKIGPFVLDSGFLDIVRERNRLAKMLGYEDFYDYKVTQAEGFGKTRLFEILDGLEARTRELQQKARARLAEEKGESVLDPWNTGFMLSGDLKKREDPYFPFEHAVEMWARSFAALGIRYKDAVMTLDLLDRKGKYSNGFCHWTQPCWVRPDGTWQPSSTNFTSLADPEAVGSGKTALTTLMHEAGHAAHFANVEQPSPLFAQERAPTSVAYAENQSMFLDALCDDAAWQGRYCRNREGEPIPWELVEERIRTTGPYEVFQLSSMLAVPFFERALYELPDDQLTADRVAKLADDIEVRIQGGLSARPLLSVPHILSDESSCYYHGYVLADMAVHQTREFFMQSCGKIVDNPEVGEKLAESYWKCGNAEMFLDLVQGLTGKPLTGDAWVASLQEDIDERVKQEHEQYNRAIAFPNPRDGSVVDLGMRMRLVDGDEVIADTADGTSFVGACEKFETYIQQRKEPVAV